jgi:ectoine hydroxylase-related dioxygenase (phytanoyl-CoA dioxygenase family)
MTQILQSYGVRETTDVVSTTDSIVEEIRIMGYAVMEGVLSDSDLEFIREKIDEIYETQVNEIGGLPYLAEINDVNLVRLLLAYDDLFLTVATNARVLEVVEKLLGDYFILGQQNAIINPPDLGNYQSSWHRDLSYQHFVSSRPLAVSALFCIDDFSPETGGTHVLSGSHKFEPFPSEQFVKKYEHCVSAKAGSVLIFDAMLYHRAGANTSKLNRRALNHLYTLPFLKQQISISQALHGRFSEDPFLRRFLGYDSEPGKNVTDWRMAKIERSRKLSQE